MDRAWTLNAQTAGNRYYRFHFWDGTASICLLSLTLVKDTLETTVF